MKMLNKGLKIFAVVLIITLVSSVFTGCLVKKETKELPPLKSETKKGTVQKWGADDKKDNPVTNPQKKNNALTPEIDSVELAAESTERVYCQTEEQCVEIIEKFANPTGNKYDALSVVGEFQYPDMSNEEIMSKLQSASDVWHKEIVEKVGEKCIVNISLDEKSDVDLSDERVAEFNSVNRQKAEAYANVKCYVTTNYADNEVKISFDLVKLNGNWYLAKLSTLNLIKNAITTELYR